MPEADTTAGKLPEGFSVHEITSLDDLYYDAWLDLYQQSFPLNEQMLISELNRTLRSKAKELSPEELYWALLDGSGQLTGMARFNLPAGNSATALWYVAMRSEARSQGIGSRFYQAVIEHIRRTSGETAEAVVFEVETPANSNAGETSDAERRIAFYRRNGARLLTGIRYVQSVGWQPPIEMSVMLHPLAELSPSRAFELAKATLGATVQQIGELHLD